MQPHRVETDLLPGEEVAAGIPDVAFPQQLAEGPLSPRVRSSHRDPAPEVCRVSTGRENPGCVGPEATGDGKQSTIWD